MRFITAVSKFSTFFEVSQVSAKTKLSFFSVIILRREERNYYFDKLVSFCDHEFPTSSSTRRRYVHSTTAARSIRQKESTTKLVKFLDNDKVFYIDIKKLLLQQS